MSLRVDYRPKTLDDVFGNEATIDALKKYFSQNTNRINHCHIVSGESGTGKTTIVRALATSILGADELLGIHEINTANNRGIDTAKEIIEKMKHQPLSGGPLVFILDEAHGMTPDAKRAFLKPTEEPPQHVYFFFCTTNLTQFVKGDEGKALATRSTKWTTELLSPRLMARLLYDVASKENYEIDDRVITELVNASNGSAREGLGLLEQIMSIDSVDKQLELLTSTAGSDDSTLELCRALVSKSDWGSVSKILSKLKSTNPESIRRSVLGYCSAVLLKNANTQAAIVLDEFNNSIYDSGFPGIVLASWRALN